MCETEEILQNLKKAAEKKEDTKIIQNLKLLPKETELDDILFLRDLLESDNFEILKVTIELVAELAKIESNRKIFTNEHLVKDIIHLLDYKDLDIVINSIRALGNICYENEEACNIIDKIGVDKLQFILKDDASRKDSELTSKTAGLFLNLLNMSSNLGKVCLKNGLFPIIEDLLAKYSKNCNQNETLLVFLISIINSLEYLFDEQDVPFTKELCKLLIDIFKQSVTPEISIPCLEIFHSQCGRVCASEDIKTLIAKEGVCELLFEHIEKYRHLVEDDESRSILKMACDFIVIVLTGDDCMNLLYQNGEGIVYQNIISWLDSEDPDLLTTSVLAIGNFARKDIHCIHMMKTGISKKLLKILKKYNTSTDIKDVKIQHALLSTLKNLVIPKENKENIIKEGLIDTIYPMINSKYDLVIFKLLGTFRIVIEDQETTALHLATQKELISKLVQWSDTSEHLGVRGEVPRLLAWLIKYSRSTKPIKLLLDTPGAVKCLVDMISSNHALMHNEALTALYLVYVGCPQVSPEDGKVLPRYHQVGSSTYYFHLITGTVILFNVCANLVAIMMCETSIKGLVLPTEMKPDWRFCSVCETITPPRSWHCSVCNICILKRDHHCMFTGCCIGLENHRYFIVFLLYTLAATIYSSYYNLTFVAEYISFDWSWMTVLKLLFPLFTFVIEWTENQFFIFVIIIVLLGAFFTGALLVFHVDLMLKSVVTHEKRVTKYDRGKLENIKLTLGERWYLVWLSPWIESKLPCDGINWDKITSDKEK
ncbi:unnamed protein product [Phyllotreta striolata]|uniref:Palmitoyltransferase n=1 Tax=Phyllotreta striolata TaxID=444603 RepID=A0A9N9XU60_PHYSR|nr:unnamed protein product [Phyllotreta striolata]